MPRGPLPLPKLPSPPRPAALAGGARPPRGGGFTQESFRGYPEPPAWFVNSRAEWVVYWYLTARKGWKRVTNGSPPVRGRTFFYQVSIPALGIFTKTESTRVDFLIPGLGAAGYEALAIDPYNEFTHAAGGLDRLKRQVLDQQEGIQLVWIHTSRLEAGDTAVIEQALRGVDVSPRALGG